MFWLPPPDVSASQLEAAVRTLFWRQNLLDATANREANATGGRRQKIFWRQVDLEIAYSGFRLPFGGGNQKFYLEAECFGGHRQSGGESH